MKLCAILCVHCICAVAIEQSLYVTIRSCIFTKPKCKSIFLSTLGYSGFYLSFLPHLLPLWHLTDYVTGMCTHGFGSSKTATAVLGCGLVAVYKN